jgi:hypothetical protein
MQKLLNSLKILFLLIINKFIFISIFAFDKDDIDPNHESIIDIG